MKPNWKVWLIFFIGLFLIDYIIFIIIVKGCSLFKNEDLSTTLHHPKSDILILGASHAQESFNPSEISKHLNLNAFNLGSSGHNPLFINYQTQLLLQKKNIPKIVILVTTYDTLNEISLPHVLCPLIPEKQLLNTISYFSDYRSLNSFRKLFLTDIYSSSARILLSRCISYTKNKSFDVPMPKHPERGYVGRNHSIQPGEQPSTYNKIPFQINHKMLKELQNTIDFWNQYQVPVLLIDTPEFIGTRLGRDEYEKFTSLVNNLSKQKNCIFKSFNQPHIQELTRTDYFRDGGWGIPNSHLNRRGAIWFNKIFCEWLKQEIDLSSL